MQRHTLMLFGHADLDPATNTLNRQLAERYTRGFEAEGGALTRINVSTLSFDPVLRTGFRTEQALEPDLLRVKAAIEAASDVVWVFPMHWASPPAVIRGLFDRLFLPGWAFRYEGGNALPKGLMAGKSSRVILTMDSPWFWYTFVNHRPIHRSFGGASLKFCGFGPVRFSTVYGVRGLSPAARARQCAKLEQTGRADAKRGIPQALLSPTG